MLEVYTKSYHGRIGTDVTYYFFITKKFYQVIYEMVSDVDHVYSRYTIELSQTVKDTGKIENDVYRYTPLLFSEMKAQRRLAILSKFVLYIISENTGIPIYKLPRNVTYYHNGVELTLSQNAFIKSAYELIPRFEKIYHS